MSKAMCWAAVFSLMLLSGCGGGRTASESSPPVPPVGEPVDESTLAGRYEGNLVVGEELLSGAILFRPEGQTTRLEYQSEFITGSGLGRFVGGRFLANVEYGEEGCLGILSLIGRIVEDGAWLTGEFRAQDCTGSMEGRFSFKPVGG